MYSWMWYAHQNVVVFSEERRNYNLQLAIGTCKFTCEEMPMGATKLPFIEDGLNDIFSVEKRGKLCFV